MGLTVGYWRYPNRAIRAFEACQNVYSAEIGGVNHDVDLEEFDILVEFEGKSGRQREVVSFRQYPTDAQIAEYVATIECLR
ncbi:MAG: hypothetical protein AAF430_12340 [Myxococcota bacterium]